MTPPSDREDTLCAMFESFCAATIRNFGRNLKRAMKNRQKHDGTSEESVDYLIGQLATEDVYTAEQFVLEVDRLEVLHPLVVRVCICIRFDHLCHPR